MRFCKKLSTFTSRYRTLGDFSIKTTYANNGKQYKGTPLLCKKGLVACQDTA